MSDPTSPREQSEALTGPVATPPPTATQEHTPQTVVHTPQSPSRLNKAAAWVGIAAGSVFIVAVIFGTGFVLGQNAGDAPGRHHGGGPAMMMRPGPGPGPGPAGGDERGRGFPGQGGPERPGAPEGPRADAPRPPAEPGTPATSAPARP